MRPKVSIVVPLWGKEECVTECVASVLEQTLKDIEVICVAYGAEHSFPHAIQVFQKDNERIRLLHRPDSDPAAAMDAAVSQAQGEYIAFLDPSGFYPTENIVEDLYTAAQEHNADICGGTIAEPNNNARHFDSSTDTQLTNLDYDHTRFLYKVSLIQDNSLSFSVRSQFKNYPFHINAILHASSFYLLPDPTYAYHYTPSDTKWNPRSLKKLAMNLSNVITAASKNNNFELCKFIISEIDRNYASILYKAMNLAEFDEPLYKEIETLFRATSSIQSNEKTVTKIQTALSSLLTGLSIKKAIVETPPKSSLPTNLPLVSVIVPVYNGEEYLEPCLESVLQQTLPNIQIIIVNDGSTDSSLTIAEKLAAKDARVEIITKENGGLSSARNAGMAAVKGSYIQFLDCDDMLASNALEILYQYANENCLEQLFFSATTFFDSYKAFKENSSYVSYYDYKKISLGDPLSGQDLFSALVQTKEFKPSACLQFLSKDFLDKYKLKFYDGIIHEDNLFTIECLACSGRTAVIPDHLYLRRVRESSIMTTRKNVKNSYGYFVTVNAFVEFLSNSTIHLSDEFEKSVLKQNQTYLSDATRWYQNTSEDEIAQFANGLSQSEKISFCSIMDFTSELRKSYDVLKKTSDSKAKDLAKLNTKLNKSQKEIAKLKSSKSWKIGRTATWPLRKIKQITKRKTR